MIWGSCSFYFQLSFSSSNSWILCSNFSCSNSLVPILSSFFVHLVYMYILKNQLLSIKKITKTFIQGKWVTLASRFLEYRLWTEARDIVPSETRRWWNCPWRRSLSSRFGHRNSHCILECFVLITLVQTSVTLSLCISAKFLIDDPFTETVSLVWNYSEF